jgi:hypothetical protein
MKKQYLIPWGLCLVVPYSFPNYSGQFSNDSLLVGCMHGQPGLSSL